MAEPKNSMESPDTITVEVDLHPHHCSQISTSIVTTNNKRAKTTAERSKEYRFRTKKESQITNRRKPKSAAERAQDYRARKKIETMAASDLSPIHRKHPKTAAQRMQEYRARKKKEAPLVNRRKCKSAAERAQEYRARKRAKMLSGDSTMEEIFIKSEPPVEITIQPEIQLQNLECTVKIEPYEDDNMDYNAHDNKSSSFYDMSHKTEYSLDIQHPIESQEMSQLDIVENVYENGKINRLNCIQSNEMLKNRVNLQNHIKHVHTEHQIVECSECFRTFKSLRYLKSHMTSVHPKAEEVTCEHCQKVFMNRKKLNNHLNYMHQQPEQRVRCMVCSKTLKSHSNLKSHMKNVHPEGEPHPCPFCYKTFKVEMLLQRHMKSSHLEDGLNYKCQECNKILPSMDIYKTHMINIHPFDRVPCHLCQQTFKTKKALRRHLWNIHNGREAKEDNTEVTPYIPGDYLCKICRKEFKSQINLQNHISITHAQPEATQAQPCETCQEAFKCSLHLRKSLAVQPGEEFPCQKTSTQDLNKHKMHVNKGVKYSICNIKQVKLDDLKRKVHPEFGQGPSTDNIQINDVPCSKCDGKISKSEIKRHEDSCEGQPIFEVIIKTEVEDT